MKTCSPHQFHEKKKGKNADFVLYTRDECAVVCEFCVFYLCENVSASTKKKKKRITAFILAPFCLWPPDTDRWSIRSPPLRTRKKMFSTVFSESRVLPQKKNLLDLQKKPKVKQKKLRIAIKQKREWKRKKIVKTTSHTTYLLTHPIEAPLHTYTNSPKLHP